MSPVTFIQTVFERCTLATWLIGSVSPPFTSTSTDSNDATLQNPVETTSEKRVLYITLDELWYFDQSTGEILARLGKVHHQHRWAMHVDITGPVSGGKLTVYADGTDKGLGMFNSGVLPRGGLHIDANHEVRLTVARPLAEQLVNLALNGSQITPKWACTKKKLGT